MHSLVRIGILTLSLLLPSAVSATELRWVPRATVPQMPKEGFTVTEFKGKLWMVGGFGSNLSSTYPNQILSSEDGLAWSAPAASFPFLERKGHAAVVFNDKLYIIGGRKANETLAGDMWRSSDGLYWEKVDADPAVAARYGHAAGVHGRELWVTGGADASGALRKDAWLTYNGDYWMAPLADFLIGRSGHRMASHEGYLWAAGGMVAGTSGPKPTGEVWLSPINGGNWTVESSDLDFNVRTQGLASVNGGIWAFGSSLFSGPIGVFGGFSVAVRQGLDAWRFIPSLSESGGTHEDAEVVHFQNTFFRFGSLAFEDHVASMEPFYKLNLVAEHGRILFVSEGDISTPDHFYRPGTSGYLVSVPDSGYAFGGWSGDVQGESDHQAITLDRDKTAIALFESAFPVVTVNVTGNGRVSPSGAVTVPHGTDALFEIRPRSGSRLIRISVDGQDQPLGSSLNLKNVRRDKTLLVQFEGCTPAVIQPNYVKLLTYDDEGAAPVTTYAVPDGFGSPAQNQLDMGGGSFLVSANIEDGVGLVTKEVKPYVASGRTGFRFEPMECEDVVLKANDYYNGATEDRPDAEGYAYSEVRYRMEPAAQSAHQGIPGKAFSVDTEEGGHPNRMWRFGALGPNDFLSPAELTVAGLEAMESPYGGEYQLTVSRDPNGHFSQVMTDQFGNVVARWGNPSPSDASLAVVSKAAYDIMGRLTEDVPPLGTGYQSAFVRSLAGQLLSEKTPDGGITDFRYDVQGRVRFAKTAKQRFQDLREPSKNHYLLFAYDALDRLISVSENNGSHSFDVPDGPWLPAEGDSIIHKRFLHDELTLSQLQSFGLAATLQVLQAVSAEVKPHPGQLAATLALGPGGLKTATVFSYDPRGMLSASYLFLPGNAPVQKFEYTYDLAGKVLEETYFNGFDPVLNQWQMENLRNTEYNALGLETQVNIDGVRRFAFEYQKNGALAREKLYMPGQTQPVEELGYLYTVQDWVKRISTPGATPRFRTTLDYGDLFNGDIHKAEYAYELNSTTKQTKDYTYGYDGLDRLVRAQTAVDPDYASYGYDAQGRLTRKKEGSSDLPAFTYTAGTNQVEKIPGHVHKGHPNTFVYDPDGNLVLDRSKKMTLDYDALGQTTAFRIYADIPEETLTWEDVEENGLELHHGRTLVEKVTVAYDAFGQRVWKHALGQSTEKGTAFVGDFAELVSPDGDGPWTLAGLNHWTPMGLRGRREAGNEYVYLTDHMGSVRMGLNSEGQVVEGVDYTPYGWPLPLSIGSMGIARHGYTEKEHDAETRLTYFGARYLDPEVGSWTAMDPIGQYHNSYSFVGGNPINWVDPWGLEAGRQADIDHGTLGEQRVTGVGPQSSNIPTLNICCAETPSGNVGQPVPVNFTTEKHPGMTEELGPVSEADVQSLVKASVIAMGSGPGGGGKAVAKSARYLTKAGSSLGKKLVAAMGSAGSRAAADATGEAGAKAAGGVAAKGVVGLDANAVIGALEKGQLAQVTSAIAGRTPTVSITAAKEFLRGGGNAQALRSFLAEYGGRIGLAATSQEIAALRATAAGMGRSLSFTDAAVAGSAIRESATLITNDGRLFRFMNAAGYPATRF